MSHGLRHAALCAVGIRVGGVVFKLHRTCQKPMCLVWIEKNNVLNLAITKNAWRLIESLHKNKHKQVIPNRKLT